MDNYYTSPILFYNLLAAQTGATGTCKQNRVGLPKTFKGKLLKKKGDMHAFTYCNQMKVMKIYDRKAVALLSTVSTEEMVPTGKSHWQMKVPTEKLEIYNIINTWEVLTATINCYSILGLFKGHSNGGRKLSSAY